MPRIPLLITSLSLLGMLLTLLLVTAGQDARRARETLELREKRNYWNLQLYTAQTPVEKAEAARFAAEWDAAGIPSYAKRGRQFTSWDGYRYEEVITSGYLFHLPSDSDEIKQASSIWREGWPERRLKNVVWYPLYPLCGAIVSTITTLPAHHALTAVSWLSTGFAALIFFKLAQNHFTARADQLGLNITPCPFPLTPTNTAALLAVLLLLFGPCSVFLYANFTESLFTLLLASFLYFLQSRRWLAAALIAAVASSSRSQGVLFGPILALTFLVQAANPPGAPCPGFKAKSLKLLKATPFAFLLGCISAIGIFSYMAFLYVKFQDPIAFMHAQVYWNVGLGKSQLLYALNPLNALQRIWHFLTLTPMDLPRLWEALCLLWPPILLLAGRKRLSFELALVGWILWALPYISNSLAGNPPMDTQWMSMGRFIAVSLPLYLIAAPTLTNLRAKALLPLIPWLALFTLFAYLYGTGAWVG